MRADIDTHTPLSQPISLLNMGCVIFRESVTTTTFAKEIRFLKTTS